MSRRRQNPEPFLMLFPWLRATGLLCFFAFVVIFIFRLSETGGPDSRRACIAAVITILAACLCGLYPLGKIWRSSVHAALIAIMIGSAIRLLIVGAGVAIITLFTQLNKSWYIFYLGVYYVFFMAVDMAFALWMLGHCKKTDNKEQCVHGNMWDMVS